MKKFNLFFLSALAASAFFSCDNDDDINLIAAAPITNEVVDTITETVVQTETITVTDSIIVNPIDLLEGADRLTEADFVLQLLHYADVDGNEEVALDAVDEFSAIVDGFKNDATYGSQTLVVSSGDLIIPGPRFFAGENSAIRAITGSNEVGHVDIAIANALGVQAAAVGNHELDFGPGDFADATQPESRNEITFPGATFPYLSANIDFSPESDFNIGIDGEFNDRMATEVASYTVAEVNGELVGIVGASAPTFPTITSIGSLIVTGQGGNAALAAEIQPSVDALKARGINKIILLAHMQQITIEKELASLLDGVDIIVAGGSNTRMGDSNDTLFSNNLLADDAFTEAYPYQATDAAGDPVLVVNVDGDFKYLGRLVVGFDSDGVLDVLSLDEELNGSYAATADVVTTVGGSPMTEVTVLQDALNMIIDEQQNNIVGYSSVYLDGRRSQVRTQETNLGNLTADANLWYANLLSNEPVQISLKNGGGIRTDIGAAIIPPGGTADDLIISAPEDNEVSEGDLKAVLRFDNGLVRLTVTATELKDIMEHAVAGTESGATPGQFPQVSGIAFTYDVAGTPRSAFGNGARITDLTVGTEVVVANGAIVGNATRTFNLVTLNFLANGGDDYPYPNLSAPNRINFYDGTGFGDAMDFPDANLMNDPGMNSIFSDTGGEQDALAEYMLATFSIGSPYDVAETPADQDARIIQVGGAL